mmetsp:Transcript_15527/g.47341  ORF Transcript_15527/g.47341 Transcript_15527/m.47341 type:complete len:344 (+) Transcript_15527:1636-2667(+)
MLSALWLWVMLPDDPAPDADALWRARSGGCSAFWFWFCTGVAGSSRACWLALLRRPVSSSRIEPLPPLPLDPLLSLEMVRNRGNPEAKGLLLLCRFVSSLLPLLLSLLLLPLSPLGDCVGCAGCAAASPCSPLSLGLGLVLGSGGMAEPSEAASSGLVLGVASEASAPAPSAPAPGMPLVPAVGVAGKIESQMDRPARARVGVAAGAWCGSLRGAVCGGWVMVRARMPVVLVMSAASARYRCVRDPYPCLGLVTGSFRGSATIRAAAHYPSCPGESRFAPAGLPFCGGADAATAPPACETRAQAKRAAVDPANGTLLPISPPTGRLQLCLGGGNNRSCCSARA